MTPTLLRPADPAALADILLQANAEGGVLEPRGGGSKAAFGGWTSPHPVIDLRGLSGVIDYDHAELVITAWTGTPIAEIEALVESRGQMLAFEPMDYAGALGGPPGMHTLGGVIAANVSGPRRLSHGAARDHVLGFEAVTGGGERFKAGGKVVKNVTGFDLSKLITGSWGTLAVVTQATIRVLPAPRDEATLLLHGLCDADAVAAMILALQAPLEVSAAAHRPGSATALRLEGFGPSVLARLDSLRALLASFGKAETIRGAASATHWFDTRHLSDVSVAGALWRVSLAPSQGAAFTKAIGKRGDWSFDWGGGLVWLQIPEDSPLTGAEIRAAAERHGGHATLVRPKLTPDLDQPAFPPEPAPVAALTARIKRAFDPNSVLADRRRAPAPVEAL